MFVEGMTETDTISVVTEFTVPVESSLDAESTDEGSGYRCRSWLSYQFALRPGQHKWLFGSEVKQGHSTQSSLKYF